ncbi:alanyl-tRNA editing protein [Wenzhouxiangella sp. AB-CW3]|uniref:alanyl-tRNA editing protein n=1 Tax=Wenzhouxiangella sp. AB-CW3 TaxID=2771012 RepID=UPI00168B1940|nr:alanyl-tRNA editing protein [Wenzhouxiangella sp. AB-CW3]QOC22144.1 alanyl-tRNA editing protein [Wenzhouxiangella sp. AB-CW3]
MTTDTLFRDDAYRTECTARVEALTPGGVILCATVFYPQGGGQPGDTGTLSWNGGEAAVIDTRHGDDGAILHVLAAESASPGIGTEVKATIDFDRRHRLMRMHTCLHLLSAVLPYPVTGGQVGDGSGRLDFDLPDAPHKSEVEQRLNELIRADHPVGSRWIEEAELEARPELVKTMSVQPPKGAGRIRLIDIPGVDLQPCGGTHVERTAEIGTVRVKKIEKKGRQNRRVKLELLEQTAD